MTYRCLHGLTFKVWSPSLWELCARDDTSHIALVTISYEGDGWNINALMKRGHTIRRGPFRSLTQAVQLIAFGVSNTEASA
jgi:hypothetical protein